MNRTTVQFDVYGLNWTDQFSVRTALDEKELPNSKFTILLPNTTANPYAKQHSVICANRHLNLNKSSLFVRPQPDKTKQKRM